MAGSLNKIPKILEEKKKVMKTRKKTKSFLSLTTIPLDCLGFILEHLSQPQIPSLRLVCRFFNVCLDIGSPVFNYWFTKEFRGVIKSVKKLSLEGTGIQIKLSKKVQKMGPIIRKDVLRFSYRHPLVCQECTIIKRVKDRLKDEPKCGTQLGPPEIPCRGWDKEREAKFIGQTPPDDVLGSEKSMKGTWLRRLFTEDFSGFGKFNYLKSMSEGLFKNNTTFNSNISKHFIVVFNFIFRTNIPEQMLQIHFTIPTVPEKMVAVYLLTSGSKSNKSRVQMFMSGTDIKIPERRKMMVPETFRLKMNQFQFLYTIGCELGLEKYGGPCLKCRTWYDIRRKISFWSRNIQCNTCGKHSLCGKCSSFKSCHSQECKKWMCGFCIARGNGFRKTICGNYLCRTHAHYKSIRYTKNPCKYCDKLWCGSRYCVDLLIHRCDDCKKRFCSGCIEKHKKDWPPPCSEGCERHTICKECWFKRTKEHNQKGIIFNLVCKKCTDNLFLAYPKLKTGIFSW